MSTTVPAPHLFSATTRCGVVGALLLGCCLLPLDAESGMSAFGLFIDVLRGDVVSGLLLGLTLGLPYLFGLLVLLRALTRGSFGAWAIASAQTLLIVEVFMLGLMIANRGEGIAPLALLGVSGSAALARLGEFFAARVRPTPVAFFVRWGALLIAATFGWLRLQFVGGDVEPGIAIVATALSAAMLAAAAAVPKPQPTA
ncbi:MAG: hypothetical protein ACE37F_21830 [Nannocystaceae bacterium]|nr:hypothetical protein [bacterium]